MKKTRLTEAARWDFLDAIDWYRTRSETAAADLEEEIARALLRIEEAPARYPATRGKRRRFVLTRFPYDVVYRVTDEAIEVTAIAHHKRRPAYWRKR
jgi:plasmid stabilization system protein ParE